VYAVLDVRGARRQGQVPRGALRTSSGTVPAGARRLGPRTDPPDDGPRHRRPRLPTQNQPLSPHAVRSKAMVRRRLRPQARRTRLVLAVAVV